MGAFASIGILVIQIMVSMAVASFFWGDHRGVGVLCRLIAPIVSASGLALCLGFVIRNLSLLSGSESWVTEAFPIMVAVIGVFGALTAVWMRKKRPEAYENLGRSFN
jgi:uncharacterized membrane protein SirB2